MATLALFIFVILHWLLQAVIWLIVASVIVSWLVSFDVINLRNRFAYQVVRMLEAATQPMLRPLRRVIPPLGGLDITPMLLIILIIATDEVLLPAAYNAVVSHAG